MDGLIWGPITRDDLAKLVDLARACYQVDGGIHSMFEPDQISSRFFPDDPGAAIGAVNAEGQLVACSAVSVSDDSITRRATLVGHVRPDIRKRGLGTYLMQWSQVQAQNLLAGAAADRQILRIPTESLTDSADRLYLAHGFENVFEALVMGWDLRRPVPDHPLPPDVSSTNWQPDLADQFFQAYDGAFRDRPGFPGYSAEQWITGVTENDHKPEWTLLAYVNAVPVGFVIGNIDLSLDPPGGHIAQVGVIPSQRNRGIGSALLVETMRRMQAEGALSARLEVHVDNPGAIQTYADLGFVTIGRRARYERIVQGSPAGAGSPDPRHGPTEGL
jgi:ribosomal protein S18 acetylase RimI-like enzyme